MQTKIISKFINPCSRSNISGERYNNQSSITIDSIKNVVCSVFKKSLKWMFMEIEKEDHQPQQQTQSFIESSYSNHHNITTNNNNYINLSTQIPPLQVSSTKNKLKRKYSEVNISDKYENELREDNEKLKKKQNIDKIGETLASTQSTSSNIYDNNPFLIHSKTILASSPNGNVSTTINSDSTSQFSSPISSSQTTPTVLWATNFGSENSSLNLFLNKSHSTCSGISSSSTLASFSTPPSTTTSSTSSPFVTSSTNFKTTPSSTTNIALKSIIKNRDKQRKQYKSIKFAKEVVIHEIEADNIGKKKSRASYKERMEERIIKRQRVTDPMKILIMNAKRFNKLSKIGPSKYSTLQQILDEMKSLYDRSVNGSSEIMDRETKESFEEAITMMEYKISGRE